MLPAVLTHLRDHLDPWLVLAGGATEYVEVGTTVFAVCTTDVSVSAGQMAKLLAANQPSDRQREIYAEHDRQRRHDKSAGLRGFTPGARV